MIKDDTKEQISLFDLPGQEDTPSTEEVVPPSVTKQHVTAPKRDRTVKQRPHSSIVTEKPATRQGKRSETVRPSTRGQLPKGLPGAVPDGDVRLTANVRLDLHLKLKIAAATRRTTIGELLENLVEQYL